MSFKTEVTGMKEKRNEVRTERNAGWTERYAESWAVNNKLETVETVRDELTAEPKDGYGVLAELMSHMRR